MTTMKAVELHAPGKFRLRTDVPVPEPGPDEVRIRVEAAGICGTDVHICQDDASMRGIVAPPVVLGHEFCGLVDKVGRNVTRVRPGEYVSAEMHEVCYQCPACRDKQYHACSKTKIRGVNLPGAFAEYVVVSGTNVVKLPAGLPRKVAAILDPLGNAVHTALKVPVQDRAVAIVGYGPIGAMCAEVVLFAGCKHLFIVDVSDRSLARARGWLERRAVQDRVTIVDARETPGPVPRVIGATEGGVDVSLEMSGHPSGINNAIQMTRAAGHVVHLGIPKDADVAIQGFGKNVIFKGLTLHAVIGREMFATWDKMLDLLQRGMTESIASFVTAELPLESFGEGLDRFAKGLEGKVVLYPQGVPARR
ncbi:MAG: alcohol dehydrogenase catalytic domain-containing protein [Planctomycetes bacterium]|nr:alcohol dehydrogenase catalytic domain-containing protein [Planctomycetota bacterium]